MRYLAQPPRPSLREHVEYVWTLSDAPGHARERIVPSGTLELVINLHEDAFRIFRPGDGPGDGRERVLRGAMVSGCYATAFEIDTRAHADIVGVHFRPGGAARMLGVPAGALANDHVALEDLWGPSATELRERLCEADGPRQRLDVLEHALAARASARASVRPAVAHALVELERPGIEVGDVARGAGLSRRRLIEIFTEDVGMTPKRYAMVRRFQRALAVVEHGRPRSWARVALDSGYYDQAHLCRDWAALTGVSPTEFVGLGAIAVKVNHLAVPAVGVNSVQAG